MSFGDARKLLESGPRWDVAEGGFAALQRKIGPGYRVSRTSQILGAHWVLEVGMQALQGAAISFKNTIF